MRVEAYLRLHTAGCAAACCRVASVQAVLMGKQPCGCVKRHQQLGIKLSYFGLSVATNTLHSYAGPCSAAKGSEEGLSNKQRYNACVNIIVGKSRETLHAAPQPDAGQLAGSRQLFPL